MRNSMDEAGISIEVTLPLDWQLDPTPSPSTLELRRQGNIAILQALAAMESAAHDLEHDLPEAVRKSMDRIESKLDVVLMLIAGLARQSTALPQERPVNLYVDRICWQEDAAPPQIGQLLLVRIFLSPRVPQPLSLQAVVKETNPQSNTVQVVAALDESDEELSEWLTRTIFRYHRRALHARRQP
jgi:hypothetical protein